MTRGKTKTFKDWLRTNFDKTDLYYLCTRGAQSGFTGMATTEDTNKLYDRFHNDIWETMAREVQTCSSRNLMQYMADCLDVFGVDDEESFKTAMVWHTAQWLAWELLNEEEEDGGDQDV